MSAATDKQRLGHAEWFTKHVVALLKDAGYTDVSEPEPSGNVEGWIVSLTDPEGVEMHVEICPSVWEDDESTEDESPLSPPIRTKPPEKLIDRAFEHGTHIGQPWCGTVYCPVCIHETFDF